MFLLYLTLCILAIVFAFLADTESKWYIIPSAFCACVAFTSLLFL